MTALNTAGGIAGSLATGFLSLPHLGLQVALLSTTGMSLLIGFGAWIFVERRVGGPTRKSLILLCASIWIAIPLITKTHLPADFLARYDELVDFKEGLGSHMAVVRRGEDLELEIDGLWQGRDRKTTRSWPPMCRRCSTATSTMS